MATSAMKGARIDLVAGGEPPEVVIELKYPREPNVKNAAWTMMLGEVLKDLYRLAVVPGDVERLFVYAETRQLRDYMDRVARRGGMDLDVDNVVLRPEIAQALPTTAAVIIGTELAAHHATAKRIATHEVDGDLRLAVYQVDALGVPPTPAAEVAAAHVTSVRHSLPRLMKARYAKTVRKSMPVVNRPVERATAHAPRSSERLVQ